MDFDPADLGLTEGALVLLDSSALVYLLEGAPRRAAVVAAFREAAGAGRLRLAASTLAWAELLAGPLGRRDEAAATRARALLADSGRLVLEPVDVAVAEAAAGLVASSRVETADAIHLATALILGAEAILTNDEEWRSLVESPGFVEGSGFPAGDKKGSARKRPLVLLVDELAFELGL